MSRSGRATRQGQVKRLIIKGEMSLEAIGRILLVAAVVIGLAGLALLFAERIPFPGKLPGDILLRRGGFSFYFPVVTCIIISIALTILVNIVFWLLRK